MTTGQRITQLRLKLGLTQPQLAAQLGVKKAAISNYENDRNNPAPTVLKQMADVFGTTVEELMAGVQENQESNSYEEKLKEKDKEISRLIGIIETLSRNFLTSNDLGRLIAFSHN